MKASILKLLAMVVVFASLSSFVLAEEATIGADVAEVVGKCSCSAEGKALVEAFGDEFMPNALGRYEKARDKAAELLQTKEEMFPMPVEKGDDTYEIYCKVIKRVNDSQLDLLRARRELAHFCLHHKAGVITNDELAKADEGETRLTLIELYEEPPSLPALKPFDGAAAEFAEKFMPDSYRMYQLFTKEHGQLAVLYDGLCSDAKKMNAVYDELFQAYLFKASQLTERANALSKSFVELYTLHRIGDIEADGLAKADGEKAASLKPFADALPGFLRYHHTGFAFMEMVAIPGRDFWMGKYEVTQKGWKLVMGNNPSHFKGVNLPVENVSWDDCQEFVKRLNALPEVKASGVVYRLPTADEWEHACRAGSTGKYGLLADGTEGTFDEMGWYDGNSGDKTHPVGQKKANAFGLYDMPGNVWEWTSTAVGDNRVNCGGSWRINAWSCECGGRLGNNPDFRHSYLGFRLVCNRVAK